jgi:hypothetical protein
VKLVIDNIGDLELIEVRRRPGAVQGAAQIPYDFQVEGLEGDAGQWVVVDSQGRVSIISDDRFKAAYMRVVHRSKRAEQ